MALRLPVRGVSRRGVRFVAEFEGYRKFPYRDAVGLWTIGYGETKGVTGRSRPVSERQARRQLRRRLNRDYFPTVKALPTFRKLNQAQVDALTSFVYNVGPGGLGVTHIGRALRAGQFNTAADRLLEWDRGGGRVLPGLHRRRQRERRLFRYGKYGA